MSGKLTRVNRFSKQYYLYPEEMQKAERLYQEQLRQLKENKKMEERSKRAQVTNLETRHNQDIETMLNESGFLVNTLPTNAEWLPINLFDDPKFDLHLPSEWLSMYHNEGDKIEFRGKALVKSEDGRQQWISVRVLSFDEQTSKWLVSSDDGTEMSVFRVNLVFNCENKSIFCARFIQAYSERVFMDSFIRYNFYVDSMPVVSTGSGGQRFVKGVLEYARNLKRLRERDIISDRALVRTIDSFYCRTYNKVLFNDQIRRQREIFALRHKLVLPDDFLGGAKHRERGLVELARTALRVERREERTVYPASMDFKENFKLFCLNSVFSKRPVLKILKEVEEASSKILNLPVFDCSFIDTLTFESFRNGQECTTNKFMNHCKINWLKDVMTAVTRNLKDEQSGWYNLKNINMENYKVGKLRALLASIDLKLADILNKVVTRNYTKFINAFIDCCPDEVKLHSSSHVENRWNSLENAPIQSSGSDSRDTKTDRKTTYSAQINALLAGSSPQTAQSPKSKAPLFLIAAKLDETKVIFPEMPELFGQFILMLVQKSLEELNRLTRIEEQILKSNLDHKTETFINCPNVRQPVDRIEEMTGAKTYQDSNAWLVTLFENLKAAVARAVAPATAYIDYYRELEKELEVTPTEYVSRFESANKNCPIPTLLEEVKRVRQREASLLSRFPDGIQVGVFKIDNSEVHTRVKDMSSETEKAIYKLVEERGRFQTNDLLGRALKGLKSRLREKPKTVEEMSALNDYLQTQLVDELAKVGEQIDELREIYRVLEDNKIKVSSEDLKKFWMVVGGPKEVVDTKKALQQEFLGLKVTFEKELGADQVKFELDLETIRRSFETFSKNYELERHEEVFRDATLINENLQDMLQKAQTYNAREGLLKRKATDYGFVVDFERSFKPLFNFWRVVHTWATQKDRWMSDPWSSVDAVGAENFATEGLQTITQTINFINDTGRKQFERLVRNAAIVKKEIEDFATKVPLLVALKRQGMSDRHWTLISEKAGVTVHPNSTEPFTFQKVLDLGLLAHKAFCVEIGERASREHEIEKALQRMYEQWEHVEVDVVPFKREELLVVKTFDGVESRLDEDFATTGGMLVNPFRGPFEAEVTRWNDQLLLVSNLVDEWRRLQSQWAYLQPIFDSPDISRQLPAESNLFKKVDLFYRQFTQGAAKTKTVLKIAATESILETVTESNNDLELIQRELNNYLEVKRGKFARFYFLSNDELLAILSEAKDPTRIQTHLRKVFENLGSLTFNEKTHIVGMASVEGEKVAFSTNIVPTNKQVEDWMSDVEAQMVVAVRRELKATVASYDPEQKAQWVLNHPGQCVLSGWQSVWTHEVEEAILTNRLSDYLERARRDMLRVVTMPRTQLTLMNTIAIEALIVIEVHALEVVESLVKKCVDSPAAFEWISQLRYYLNGDACQVKCVQTEFPYGFEYLGNTSRLVITPLTDKCYMTLMGALRLNLGGAPAGPAGTGKTETTKDLAKALAKQCVVFNCQESMDHLFLAKFFKGLASAGAWCCFDEFNRINVEVLSVIAQQLQELFRAKAERVKEMRFEDALIKVEPTFSVYITMNPGYAGRTELPDNLKALFRPVAMMVPDYALIAQIKLYSFGFTRANSLARKMVDTFRLASEQLSAQRHYDYGMRAVTSVINAAGLFKQGFGVKEGLSEEQLLYKALLDVNVPKFLPEDIPLFANIVKDLFPGLVAPDQRNQKLNEAIAVACRNLNLQPDQRFIEKVLQLHDTAQVRHGLMLVGPTGGGKSSCHKVLQTALNLLSQNGIGKPVKTELISPKAMSLVDLYGESKDLNWIEGVIEAVVERAIKETLEGEARWVMFDGPVDAVWIESMNTVLDDNKKLCLSSGKVLILTNGITVMFEAEDLLVASPATVSRCGMVYVGTEGVSFERLFDSYLNSLPTAITQTEEFETRFNKLVNTVFLPALKFHSSQSVDDIFEVPDVIVVQNFIRLFDSLIKVVKEEKSQEQLNLLSNGLRDLIIFCTVWSVGTLGEVSARKAFERHFSTEIAKLQSKESIYDKEFDLTTGTWKLWTSNSDSFEVPSGTPFHEIVIPTLEFARGVKLGQTLLFARNHVLIPGPVGSGKTVCAFRLLADGLQRDFNSLSVALSARTTPRQLADYFFSQIEKRRKGVYGPKNGKRCLLFLDDINMPAREEWGAQPPLELLRQYLDHGAWHSMRLNKEYVKIEDVVVLGAMVPPKAGRNDVSRRLVRHFNVLPFTEFEERTLQSIYEKVLGLFLARRSTELAPFISSIVAASVQTFREVSTQLLPTPSKSHYVFNLRDLAKTIQGLTTLQAEQANKADVWILWQHENERAFRDRLCDQKDIDKLQKIIAESMLSHAKLKLSDLTAETDIIYSSLTSGSYARVDEPATLIRSVERLLDKHNAEVPPKSQMKLVMFLDACKYVSRMSRVLQSPQGHVLLLGVGGSGRQSLSRLAVFAVGLKLFQVEPTKGYNDSKWKEDLKRLYMAAVCDNSQLGFVISDAQIVSESFLEDLNALLNTGLLVGLPLSPEETKRLDEVARIECQRRSIPINKMNILNCQIGSLRRNLHILLSLSPAHELFAQRVRTFPSLVNCCSLNWLHGWPAEALEGVAHQFLKDNMEAEDPAAIAGVLRDAHCFVESLCVEYRKATRRVNHLTPTSYLELLNTYKRVFGTKSAELGEQLGRFETGVQKLFEANKQVEDIRDDLRREEPKLKVAEVEVKELLSKVAADKEAENETKKVVALEEAEAAAQQLEANTLKKSAEESVRLANEELDRTLEKIQLLKPASIIEIRTANNPVRKLKLVISAVCYLLLDNSASPGFLKKNITEDEFWVLGKNNLLNDPGRLFATLMAPETKDNIDVARVRRVAELVKKNRDIWDEKEMRNSSLATYYLYLWVDCILNYMEINEKTRPIRDKLAEVTKVLDEKTAFLEQKKAELDASTRRLKGLEDLYNEKLGLKEELFRRINECNIRLQRAGKLTSLLEDETDRWKAEIVRISRQRQLVVNDSLLAACHLAYFGPFDLQFRAIIEEFLVGRVAQSHLEVTSSFKLVNFLSNPIETLNWSIHGLPKDETSVINGVLITRSQRWPLMVDPQGRASRFVKNLGKTLPLGLEVVKASSPSLLRQLEQAVQLGKWVLLENLGTTIDPLLEPILLQKVFSLAGGKAISLGDKVVPYNDSFRLLMSTSLQNPDYSPEVFARVTVVNFCLTPTGLEEHLLAQTVRFENRELEHRKTEIVVVNADDKAKLKEIEDNILGSLKESKGDVLMDESLIMRLTQAKKTFSEINARLIEATATEKEIDELRERYRDTAFYSSKLYFLVSELANVDPMYQYSLQWFESLFQAALEKAPQSSDLTARLAAVKSAFVEALFDNVSGSLYSQHKLLFSFLLTVRTLAAYGQVDVAKVAHLFGGPVDKAQPERPRPSFVPESSWPSLLRELGAIDKLSRCEGLLDGFLNNPDSWKSFYESAQPELAELPDNLDSFLDEFDRLLVLRSLRPDRLTAGIQLFVQRKMGDRFVEAPIVKLEEVLASSTATQPLLFMVSSGSDPKADFDALALSNKIRSVCTISLGQGQGPKAEKMIKEASKAAGDGGWVLLQNCHLAVSWLPRLEAICEEFSADTTHPDFRLWATTMPCSVFPVGVLRNARKLTVEPPRSLKANLKITYNQLDNASLDACKSKPDEFKRLLFGLTVFHAVVQERRRFGPIGWNIPYEFTQEDFMVCRRQLLAFIDEYTVVPFKVLNFVFAEINYGGRVTDDKDSRLITALIRTFVCQNALTSGYRFSRDDRYYVPEANAQHEFLNYIESLPLNTGPEVLGLHPNSEILTNQNESLALLELARSIQPSGVAVGGSDGGSQTLSLVASIRDKLPKRLDLTAIKSRFPVSYEDSFNTVLIQESTRFNELIERIEKSTESLRLAIEGLIVLNSDLEALLKSIQNNAVPAAWSSTFLSLKPLFSWLDELSARIAFFRSWSDSTTPFCFWFNAFSFPQAFLTGTLQNYARKTQTAIDRLTFEFRLMATCDPNESLPKPEVGVYVHGLFLEGAVWDYESKSLEDPAPNELYTRSPVVLLVPTLKSDKVAEGLYQCPLYKTLTRAGTLTTTGHSSNFVMMVAFPTKVDEDHWVRRGTACFLALKS